MKSLLLFSLFITALIPQVHASQIQKAEFLTTSINRSRISIQHLKASADALKSEGDTLKNELKQWSAYLKTPRATGYHDNADKLRTKIQILKQRRLFQTRKSYPNIIKRQPVEEIDGLISTHKNQLQLIQDKIKRNESTPGELLSEISQKELLLAQTNRSLFLEQRKFNQFLQQRPEVPKFTESSRSTVKPK